MSEAWVGRTLSKVQIQQMIGRGGMADVYLGLHTTLNLPRAVKILHGHLTDDPDLQRRFREEAKSVAALRHPNIVQVYDFDLIDGSPYIVMELLRGLSMSAYLKALHRLGHSLPLETVARLLDRVGSALDYAHSEGIIHRDVKPANVILRQGSVPLNPSLPLPADCEPILTDFGIARISTATSQTLTGTILGTPAYMSPEQVRGEPVDARSDNYSLGIMLYEMLAGVLPFDPEVDTTASVLYKQANVPPPPLANTSPRIQAVVDRALHKDKNARYQKAGDLAVAFRGALQAGETTVVSRGGRPGTAARSTARPRARIRPLYLGLAGLAAVALCAGAIGLRVVSGLLSSAAPTTQAAEPTSAAPTSAPPTEVLPIEVAPTPAAVEAAGGAIYQDASMQAILRAVPGPGSGFAYAAWLIGTDGAVRLAGVDFNSGGLSVSFVDPDGANLPARFDEFAVSLEPDPDPAPDVPGTIRFTSRLPEDVLAELRRLDDVSNGQPSSSRIISGMRSEASTHDSHLGFSLAAVQAGNLTAAKQHAEHTINILEGEASQAYGDWDQNGRAENPGDRFGLIPYLRLAVAMVNSELQNPEISPETQASLQSLAGDLEAALEVAEDSSRQAQRVVAVDTIDEIRPLEEEWSAMMLSETVASASSGAQATGLRLWTPVLTLP
jgi:tRNA A-37 threonylcarbamoyl transferase component Bud32